MAKKSSKSPAQPDSNSAFKASLVPLREEIDAIDDRIIELLNRRAAVAQQIGHLKAQAHQPAYVPERERQVLARLVARSKGPLGPESLHAIYKEIISASLALEHPLKVAYAGPEATPSHAASKLHFGLSAHLQPCQSIAEVFSHVECNRFDYGVVPIENTADGIVHRTLDLFVGSDLVIGAEVLLRLNHHLLTRSGDLQGIKEVYAHPDTLEPCRVWLETHLPGVPVRHSPSTEQAADLALGGDVAVLVASSLAASIYGLRVAASNLEETGNDFSRFLVVGHDEAKPSGNDRTSIIFAIMRDRPGLLYEALQSFAQSHINLTRIESRPSRRRNWDYLFFIDVDGHKTDAPLAQAIEQLGQACVFLKVLGSYPRGSVEVPKGGTGAGHAKEV